MNNSNCILKHKCHLSPENTMECCNVIMIHVNYSTCHKNLRRASRVFIRQMYNLRFVGALNKNYCRTKYSPASGVCAICLYSLYCSKIPQARYILGPYVFVSLAWLLALSIGCGQIKNDEQMRGI